MSSIDQTTQPAEGRTYWQSLAELANSRDYLEFVKAEFPEGVDLPPESAGRRRFLQVMAASIALAGTTGCRWPKENIRPFAKRPEGMIPGKPVYFASSMDLGGVSRGLLVKSYDGRPIHVEGNDLDPVSKGSADSHSIASILDLYDPDRLRQVLKNGKPSTWAELESSLSTKLGQFTANRGAGLRFLVEASSSPSRARLQRQMLVRFPAAGWVEYEALSNDSIRLGTRLVYGADYRPQYDLAAAAVIVDLEADLLHSAPAAARNARGYAEGRDPEKESFNRLYSIESGFSITGAAADHRFAVRSSEIHSVLCQIAAALLEQGLTAEGESQSILEAARASVTGDPKPFVNALAKDLLANKGRSIVAVGASQAPASHALAIAINEALGNIGAAIQWTREPDSDRPGHYDGIRRLAEEMAAGDVDTLVVLGGNPLYDAPADLKFAELYPKVDSTVHLSLHPNETTIQSTWAVPRAHYLEAWSDGRLYDGTFVAGQPLIAPLYDGKSDLELLSFFLDGAFTQGYDVVRASFQDLARGDFEVAWREFLDRGVLPTSEFTRVRPTLQSGVAAEAVRGYSSPEAKGLEVVFAAHPSLYDGRYANNGWLQEVPDFMTKLTWDNAAILSLPAAQQLGVEFGDRIEIETPVGKVDLPVYLLPGQQADTITLHLGYGRTAAGRVGDGVGVNVYPLRTSTALWFVSGITARKTGVHYPLSSTQDHYAINAGAKNSLEPLGVGEVERRVDHLIHEQTYEEYHRHANGAAHEEGHQADIHLHHPPLVSPWKEWEYNDNKWGMTIDLNKCIGCTGCVIACQSENNIPVVGKEQVGKGREMHWLRIDRYFHGAPESAQVAHQPLTCHHCENAPCEQVCPVGATMHDHDGLNVMVYNRCIGTRYCSNNCPYKVRRFNWFNFTKNYSDVEKMVFNPEVTIRSRGVMEKCTYCVQRIQAAKIESRNENRPIADGEIRTACQQACPTRAIEFGDLNDPESRVAKLQADDRAYTVLELLNIKPRTKYLTRLRNPNPELLEA